tara:strand:+ start:1368 stop:2135 length:768 start_codon:yes stop_codon:yes gene_type:complete
MIDEVYCINIRKRPNRLRKFKKHTGVDIESKLELEINYTTEWEMNKDKEDITSEWLKEKNISAYSGWKLEGTQYFENAEWGWWSRDITKGEIGCAISHKEIWKRAKGTTLILEDDARLGRNWHVKLYNTIDTLSNIDKDWDLIYLGRIPQSDEEHNNKTLITSNIKKPLYSFCAHAYVLSKKGLDKINKYEFEKNIIPLDEFLPATYIEHPRPDIKLLYPPVLRAYAIWPIISKQSTGLSDTEDNGQKNPGGKTE